MYFVRPFVSYGADLRESILGNNGTIEKFSGHICFDESTLPREEVLYAQIRSRGAEYTNYGPILSCREVTDRYHCVGGFGMYAAYTRENDLKRLIKEGRTYKGAYSKHIFIPKSIGRITKWFDLLLNHTFAIVPIHREVVQKLQEFPCGYFTCVGRGIYYVFVDIENTIDLYKELRDRHVEYIEARKPVEHERKKMDSTVLKRICKDIHNKYGFSYAGRVFLSPTKH